MRLLLVCIVALAGVSDAKISDELLLALRMQESSNQAYPKGYNDNGKAKGWYQCHKDYWIDGCNVLQVKWSWQDAHDLEKSTKVVCAYLKRYGESYKRQTKKEPTDEIYAMIHHFGPKGWTNPDKRYWLDVKRRLKGTDDSGSNASSKTSSKKSRPRR